MSKPVHFFPMRKIPKWDLFKYENAARLDGMQTSEGSTAIFLFLVILAREADVPT